MPARWLTQLLGSHAASEWQSDIDSEVSSHWKAGHWQPEGTVSACDDHHLRGESESPPLSLHRRLSLRGALASESGRPADGPGPARVSEPQPVKVCQLKLQVEVELETRGSIARSDP